MGMDTYECLDLTLQAPRFSSVNSPVQLCERLDLDLLETYSINSTGDALARAESNDDSEFPNSLGESGLKLFVADEGNFVCWLGQGDHYDAFS